MGEPSFQVVLLLLILLALARIRVRIIDYSDSLNMERFINSRLLSMKHTYLMWGCFYSTTFVVYLMFCLYVPSAFVLKHVFVYLFGDPWFSEISVDWNLFFGQHACQPSRLTEWCVGLKYLKMYIWRCHLNAIWTRGLIEGGMCVNMFCTCKMQIFCHKHSSVNLDGWQMANRNFGPRE